MSFILINSHQANILFELQRNKVHEEYLNAQQHTRRLTLIQRRAKEAARATPVHRGTSHVEWEACHRLLHQDTEVVAQIRSRDA